MTAAEEPLPAREPGSEAAGPPATGPASASAGGRRDGELSTGRWEGELPVAGPGDGELPAAGRHEPAAGQWAGGELASGGRPEGGQCAPEHRIAPERWELLLPHRERLRRLARSRLPSAQDAEDCAQEALLRAALFPALDKSRVGAFLTSTVLRLCVDLQRGAGRQRRLRERIGGAERTPGPEELVCEAAVGAWMMSQAKQLRGRERQVMLARADGMSTADAARHLQISVKAAESALGRARARLRTAHERTLQPDGAARGRRGSGCCHRRFPPCPGTSR